METYKIKKVSAQQYEKYIKKILLRKKEKNIYILGDVENYGLNNKMIEIFVDGDVQKPYCIIMRYGNSYVVYSPEEIIHAERIKDFLKEKSIRCISGEYKTICCLQEQWENSYIVKNTMLRIKKEMYKRGCDFIDSCIKCLDEKYIEDIQALYLEIDEYSDKYIGENGISRITEQIVNGKVYALVENEKIISIAGISADVREFAMIDNVAVRAGYRGKGNGKRLLTQICKREFDSGKDFLCVYCNNPIAESLYKAVGFKEIGKYGLMYFRY